MNSLFSIFFNIICMSYFPHLCPRLLEFWSPAAEIEGNLLTNKINLSAFPTTLSGLSNCPTAGAMLNRGVVEVNLV